MKYSTWLQRKVYQHCYHCMFCTYGKSHFWSIAYLKYFRDQAEVAIQTKNWLLCAPLWLTVQLVAVFTPVNAFVDSRRCYLCKGMQKFIISREGSQLFDNNQPLPLSVLAPAQCGSQAVVTGFLVTQVLIRPPNRPTVESFTAPEPTLLSSVSDYPRGSQTGVWHLALETENGKPVHCLFFCFVFFYSNTSYSDKNPREIDVHAERCIMKNTYLFLHSTPFLSLLR